MKEIKKKIQLGQKSESINIEIDTRGCLTLYNWHEFRYICM